MPKFRMPFFSGQSPLLSTTVLNDTMTAHVLHASYTYVDHDNRVV